MKQWGETSWVGVLWWIIFMLALVCVAPDLISLFK